MIEVWKPIPGDWCRAYEVSNLGAVRATDYHRKRVGRPCAPGPMRAPVDDKGYHRLNLTASSGRKVRVKVARLVALAFVPNPDPDNRIEVDHLDNDRANDRADNLEWVTEAEQQRRRAQRMRKAGSTSSKYIGVTWHKKERRWNAQVWVGQRIVRLGGFASEFDAATAYDRHILSNGLDHPINGVVV